MITVNSPIIADGGPLSVAYDISAAKRIDEIDQYVKELHRLCDLVGFDWRILFAQAWHETAGFTSYWWARRLNPAGIGITGDSAQNDASPTWANGTAAARAHVTHMIAYVFGSQPVPPSPALVEALPDYARVDPRYLAVFDAGYAGTVHKLGDLGNGRWATDPNYATQIAAKANQLFKEEPMPTVYQIVGLPGPGIELPVPLAHQIIPLSQPNQRPGIKLTIPLYWVQHETANTAPGADAAMHSAWLNNGADGSQVSFHFAVDDGAIYQMIPVDEVTWQAADGAGPGNMSGISCELCVNQGIDTAKSRHNAEALCGGIMKSLGYDISRVKAHYDFNAADPNRHHCPDQMMNEGYWPTTFKANVAKIIAPPTPVQPVPSVPWSETTVGHQTLNGVPAVALLAEVTAKSHKSNRVAVYRDASCKKGTEIGYVPVGKEAKCRGTFRNAKGRVLYLIDLGSAGVGRSWRSGYHENLPTP